MPEYLSLGRNGWRAIPFKSLGFQFGNLNMLNEHGLIISDYNSWYRHEDVHRNSFTQGFRPADLSIIRAFHSGFQERYIGF